MIFQASSLHPDPLWLWQTAHNMYMALWPGDLLNSQKVQSLTVLNSVIRRDNRSQLAVWHIIADKVLKDLLLLLCFSSLLAYTVGNANFTNTNLLFFIFPNKTKIFTKRYLVTGWFISWILPLAWSFLFPFFSTVVFFQHKSNQILLRLILEPLEDHE